jgi:tetratricopeptide (TPR) repeat protein
MGTPADDSTRSLGSSSRHPGEPFERVELPPGTIVGRYSVLESVGEGGMGVVYEAWDPQLDRMVALKVLRIGGSYDAAPLQLLSEAQALAKMGHPNIVTVYDAGATADAVFIAMELCRGQDLRQWLAHGKHEVQEILAVFVAAGSGLAAAHRAGVVHRDFKPANVLLGDGGSVQVADFGVACIDPSIEGDLDVTWREEGQERNASTIVGTPIYMAPEQLLGRVGDHRMDQFSFCVCLYWALLDAPPFPGRTFDERRYSVPLGLGPVERERLMGARRIPRRVRRALLRGLSVEPDDRFACMDALLAELAPPRRRPWVMPVLRLGLGLGLGIGAFALAQTRDEPCAGADVALGDTWGPARRVALAEALAHTGHPGAAERLARAASAFDAYAAEWKEVYAESCNATYVTQAQSEALFDLRMHCLDRRRGQLEVAIATMTRTEDAEQLDERMTLPFSLPAIDECNDVDALESVGTWPHDPETRVRIGEIARRIDLADALRAAGQLEEGLRVIQEALREARALGQPRVLAEALECLGRLQADARSPMDAERTLREAIEIGSRSHDDRVVARAWPSLVYAMVMQDELVVAERLSFAAEAAVTRAGDELARGWLYNNLGILHSELGDHARARDYLHRALDIKTRLRGPDDFDVGITWSNLGFVLGYGGQWSEAVEAFDRAQSIFASTVGTTHPVSEAARAGLCRAAIDREEHQVALELCTEALHRLEGTSPSPALVSRVQSITAEALRGLGRLDEALEMAGQARAQVDGLDPSTVASIDEWSEQVRQQRAGLAATGEPAARD